MGPSYLMRNARGFTLIEIAVVLVIISIMIAMVAFVTRAITSGQRRSVTVTRLAGVDAALVQFVIVQRRLPCPANGTLPQTNARWGLEEADPDGNGCTTNQQNGVVPWRTLGLAQADVTDGWERLMTYRIPQRLAAPTAMDMSWCDPAGGSGTIGGANGLCQNVGCSSVLPATVATCTTPANFLANKGLQVQTVIGPVVVMNPAAAQPTGAAYVVISHGESGGGGYLTTGVLAMSTATDGTEEQLNYANLALRDPPPLYYVDDSLREVADNTHFDDIISRPSILTVVNKASLGPRSH